VIDRWEMAAILLAKKMNCPVLNDDLAAREIRFRIGDWRLWVHWCFDQLCKTKEDIKKQCPKALEKLGKVMWLTIDVL